MVIYIFGEDTFRSRQYLRQTVAQFKKQRDPQGYNVVFLDGKKDAGGKILGELSAAPFLAERRMVVVENVLSGNDKDFLQELVGRIKDKKIVESTVAVFWQGEALGKVKEIKELDALLHKEKYAQEFKKLEGEELVGWAKKEFNTRGGKISGQAIVYLCQNIGADMWLLNSLIDQLVAYKKEEIQLVDVKLFLEEKAEDNIFNMVDAVVIGNKKLAFKLLSDIRRSGEEDGYLFSMIMRQFKILLQMRDLFDREDNLTSDMVAKKLGIHPFVSKKSLPLVKKYNLAKLREVYNQLLQIDIKTKTGQGDQSMLLDLFVGKVI